MTEKPKSPFNFGGGTPERGDVALSLQEMLKTQFISKDFYDIYGATRLTPYQIDKLARMFVINMIGQILSVNYSDTQIEILEDSTKKELKLMFHLKRMAFRDMNAVIRFLYYEFMYFFGLAYQSEDGKSRFEGMTISSGATKKVFEGNELGMFDKIGKRIRGKVLYTE